jgi:carboxybiotin decarboxylase
MENIWSTLFQGISSLVYSEPALAMTRIGLILLGMLLIYLSRKEILEPLLMIPMGLGMIAINSSVLIMPGGEQGNIFVDPLVTDPDQLMEILQIDFLQPIYTLTFSNGLIACFVFMGIGSMLDISFILQRPFISMFLALFAELGTFLTIPIAIFFGLNTGEAASIAMVGGADGPMVLFTSLMLSKELFVPITVVAYLYLGLTYGGYPFLIKLLVPKKLRAIPAEPSTNGRRVSAREKIIFAVVICCILCLLFPVAGPLFMSLFLGIIIRESGLKHLQDFVSGPLLYGSTFFLGLLLGILCEAHLLLNPKIALLLGLGVLSLLLSGIGGLIGGYILYFLKRGKFNPVIGIAGVSCVPSTAKVAQKSVQEAGSGVMILPDALGANICGVITTAIIAGIYITFIPIIFK